MFSLTLVIPFLQIIFDKAVVPATQPDFHFSIQSIMENLYYVVGKSKGGLSKMNLLLLVCGAVILLFFLKNVAVYFSQHFLAPIRSGVIHDLRQKVYYKLTKLPLSYYSDQKKGDIMTRMSSDIAEIEWNMVGSFVALIRDPIQILATIGILFFFSTKLTLFVMIMLPVSAIAINRLGRSLKKSTFTGQKFLSDLMVTIEETLGGIKIMKAFTAEKYLRNKFDSKNADFVRLGNKVFRKRSASSPLSEFMGSIVIAVVIWFGGNLVLSESLSAEVFITYIAMFSQLISPAKSFSSSFYNMKTGSVMLERVEEIANEKVTITDHPGSVIKNEFTNAIEFKNVSFMYQVTPVLQNINIQIPKAKTIALVGQSGAGKSTMVDLIPRFYDTTQGNVLIDGTDVKDIRLESLRGLIGIVPQQSILFNDTILNNIAFGDENPDLERATKAAKMANAHDFISAMPDGYQSFVGEQGGKLSGGQKQRIAIARALYKDAPILILDEATSSLDNESEKLVQDALNTLRQNRTCIIVAHRLSTIQHADTIFVMEEGKVVETGTHKELMLKGGIYYKLYELSAFDKSESVN